MTLVLNGTTGVSSVDGSASTPAIQGNDTNTGVFFPAADTVAIATNGSERARVDSSGNVGIGTSSPGGKLSVIGSSSATLGSLTQFTIPGGQGFYFNSNSTGTLNTLAVGTGETLAFNTGSSERARIDSSGNLLVGTTSNANNVKLMVAGTMEVSASGTSYIYGAYAQTTGNAANVWVGSSGQLARSTSSLKYKRDVEDATHGLADVMALRAVTYKGKSEGDGDKVFGGLIAEEVHAAGLTEFVQYAEDGTPDALAYGNMVSLAFKAIQEQQTLIESLTARIAALEGAAQ